MSQVQDSQSTRKERRVPVQLEMSIEGLDAKGLSFRQKAFTVDVSRVGVRLASLQSAVALNTLLHLEYMGKKVVGRVVWLGRTPEERGQVGIRCADEASVPWAGLTETEASAASPSSEPEHQVVEDNVADWPVSERRRAARHACNILVTIRAANNSFSSSARMTDISYAGGYMESMSPLPVGTEITLELETGSARIPVTAVVRTQHPAMGNGVAFTKVDVSAMQQLESFISGLAAPPPNSAPIPQRNESSKSCGLRAGKPILALDPQIEALVELLEQKSILNREELVQYLERKYT